MILIINLAAAAFLAGLNWYLQIVHYPLFKFIDKKNFVEYHVQHLKKNIFIVFIPMLVEGAFTILFAFDYHGIIPPMIPILCLCLSTSMWIISFSHVAPFQDKLTIEGKDSETINKLIQMNWVRTVGWTVKVVLLVYCLSLVTFLA